MSVLPSITDFDEMRRPVRFVPIARDTPPPLPLGSPVQFQTAVPACIQQLSALGPHLERGELWSRCLAHWYTPCRVPAMPNLESAGCPRYKAAGSRLNAA